MQIDLIFTTQGALLIRQRICTISVFERIKCISKVNDSIEPISLLGYLARWHNCNYGAPYTRLKISRRFASFLVPGILA